jgi:hypothetical protein
MRESGKGGGLLTAEIFDYYLSSQHIGARYRRSSRVHVLVF